MKDTRRRQLREPNFSLLVLVPDKNFPGQPKQTFLNRAAQFIYFSFVIPILKGNLINETNKYIKELRRILSFTYCHCNNLIFFMIFFFFTFVISALKKQEQFC